MKVFKIKVSSMGAYTLSSTLIMLVGMGIGIYLAVTNANDVYFFILLLFGLTALVFIPDLSSTALTEWSITEEEIKIKWLSQFPYQKNLDTSINWENIEEYMFQPQRQFSLFKLRLRDNTALKYWHSNSAIDDQFDEFLDFFKKQVFEFNQKGINFLHAIKRNKTVYERKSGIALAIILAILMISFPILVLQLKSHKVNWIYVISAYSGSIYFISQVISHIKNKRQQSE